MPEKPTVSVVMGVYNGVDLLYETIDSVLAQDFRDFEFIIIDDGSTDGTRALLDRYAMKDGRICVLHGERAGLTASLIKGCAHAKGTYLARQDAGDISLPNRFRRQVEILESCEDVSMVSCGTRFIGPEREVLYEVLQSDQEAMRGFEGLSMDTIRGPSHHGSTMFRKSDYERVEGYRVEFNVAQDIDLWLRLIELGRPAVVPEVLYIAEFAIKGISTWKRNEQLAAMELALECARVRKNGRSDSEVLEKILVREPFADNEDNAKNKTSDRRIESGYYYFVGACLKKIEPQRASSYFVKALRLNPLNIKALLHLATTFGKSKK